MKSRPDPRQKCRPDLFSGLSVAVALLVIVFIGSAIGAIVIGGAPEFLENLRSPEVQFSLRMSVGTSTISTCIVLLLALPTAYALTRTGMPCKRLSSLLIELTLSLPYLLLGLSLLVIFFDAAGQMAQSHGFAVVFSPAGIVMAHLLVNLPYAVRLVQTAFAGADQRLEFLARTLGASRFRCFYTILLPMCRAQLVSTFLLTWARAMGEFGATLMLVGITRMKTETLPGNIYLSISTGQTGPAMATAMLIVLLSGIVLFLSRLICRSDLQRERSVSQR